MDIALVDGSYHGAWCWDLLRPELERLGHRVITMDLHVSDPALSAADYATVVADALDPEADTVLVGHSMAGLIIPLFLPSPGRSANDQRATEPIDGRIAPKTAEWTDLGDNVWMVGPNTATELFFHDAPAKVARWATERLRPQAYGVLGEVTPLAVWPEVESRYIVCRDDRATNPDWGRAAARERLGVEAVEIDGSHSPFLTRPAELARPLDSLMS